MGKFKRGDPKKGGRHAGTPNKVTAELRQRISDFLSDSWPTIEKDFMQLEPDKRVTLFERLLQYAVPRLQSTEIDLLERLSDEQIDQVIIRLKQDNFYGK